GSSFDRVRDRHTGSRATSARRRIAGVCVVRDPACICEAKLIRGERSGLARACVKLARSCSDRLAWPRATRAEVYVHDGLKEAIRRYASERADADGLALAPVPGLRLMCVDSPRGKLHSTY